MKQLQLAAQKDYVEEGSDEILGDLSKLSEPGTILLLQAKRNALKSTLAILSQ